MVNCNSLSCLCSRFNLNVRYMSYNKAKFNHNIAKAKEKRKLNNLFSVMAKVQKDSFKK